MSVTGLAYGAQIAYVAAVAQELVGAQDMVLAYSLEMFMQGAGGLIGGPVAGLHHPTFDINPLITQNHNMHHVSYTIA